MILDQFGTPYKPFMHGAGRGYNLPWQGWHMKDIDELITESSWKTLVSASRSLYANNGLVKSAIDQKGLYCVGQAWLPQFKGKDKEWGKVAEEWLLNRFYPICDVRGGVYDFQTKLYLASTGVDIDGDHFVLLTKSANGEPRLQSIPSHRIGCVNNEEVVESGTYAGLKIRNGAIINAKGRVVAWRVLGDNETYRDISARNIVSIFDPSFCDQSRGLPLFSHAINALRSMAQSEEFELYAQLIVSSLALIEHNESGGPDYDDPSNVYGSAQTNGTSQTSSRIMEGGMVRFFEAGSGSKIEQVKHDRPGPNFESYQNRCARIILAGAGWPYELVLAKEGQGTANRIALAQADKAILDRQSLLMPFARKLASYAVATAIENGDLPENEEFYKWGFSLPRKASIDIGRDSAARLAELEKGVRTLTSIVEEEGSSLDEHLRQEYYEKVRRKQIKAEVEAETGETIEED